MSRLRKRQIIPEDTPIRATLTDTKLVFGAFGRQVEAKVTVTEGGENNEYRGTAFKNWFSFGRDDETKEEYIADDGPLYQVLSLVVPNLRDVLDSDELSNAEYEKFIKRAVRDLEDIDIVARVGVKTNKKDDSKNNNFLQSGTFGIYRDPEEGFEDSSLDEEDVEELAKS